MCLLYEAAAFKISEWGFRIWRRVEGTVHYTAVEALRGGKMKGREEPL